MISILIISINAIGDTYISLSALEIIKRNFDQVKIDFVINTPSELLFNSINDISVFTLKTKNPLDLLKLLLKIRKINYDYVFNFFPGRYNTILTFFTKGTTKTGYSNYFKLDNWHKNSQRVKVIGRKRVDHIWTPNMTYLERIELVLDSVGILGKVIYKFKYPNISIERGRYIVLHPFSKSSERALEFNSIRLIIRALSEKFDSDIYILGTHKEFDRRYFKLQEINKIQLVLEKKIEDLVQLIINSNLFIGVDSFPLHLADAYNTNFIGLFGPTSPSSVLVNKTKSIRIITDSLFSYDSKEIVNAIMEKLNNISYK